MTQNVCWTKQNSQTQIAAVALIAMSFVSGCNRLTNDNSTGKSISQSVVAQTPATEAIAIVVATSAQCANGGTVVQAFMDANHNGVLDAGETVLSTTPVCNGLNGANGIGAGVQVTSATASECPAGGYQFTTYRDANNNGQLDAGETITSVSTVCNGLDGENGQNGDSFNFSMTAATSAQCSAGGEVYTVQEIDGSGQAIANSSSSTVICNGVNGTNGTNGQNGLNGLNGLNGANGVGTVFTTVAATQQQCPNGGSVLLLASDTAANGVYSKSDANQQSVVICNGATGATGAAGATGATGAAGPVSAFSTVAPVMPCTSTSSPWKEVLLCMADGNILSDFSATMSGDETRLAFMQTGTYEDTDASGCVFSVDSDSTGGLKVSWSAGSNQYGSWSAGSYDCQKH